MSDTLCEYLIRSCKVEEFTRIFDFRGMRPRQKRGRTPGGPLLLGRLSQESHGYFSKPHRLPHLWDSRKYLWKWQEKQQKTSSERRREPASSHSRPPTVQHHDRYSDRRPAPPCESRTEREASQRSSTPLRQSVIPRDRLFF